MWRVKGGARKEKSEPPHVRPYEEWEYDGAGWSRSFRLNRESDELSNLG